MCVHHYKISSSETDQIFSEDLILTVSYLKFLKKQVWKLHFRFVCLFFPSLAGNMLSVTCDVSYLFITKILFSGGEEIKTHKKVN